MGCVSYVGQNIFYVGHNFYVGCVGQKYFCMGQDLLQEFKVFWVDQFYFRNGQLLFQV